MLFIIIRVIYISFNGLLFIYVTNFKTIKSFYLYNFNTLAYPNICISYQISKYLYTFRIKPAIYMCESILPQKKILLTFILQSFSLARKSFFSSQCVRDIYIDNRYLDAHDTKGTKYNNY